MYNGVNNIVDNDGSLGSYSVQGWGTRNLLKEIIPGPEPEPEPEPASGEQFYVHISGATGLQYINAYPQNANATSSSSDFWTSNKDQAEIFETRFMNGVKYFYATIANRFLQYNSAKNWLEKRNMSQLEGITGNDLELSLIHI